MTNAAIIRTVEHGEASDLPETNWLWRRWFAFGFTLTCIGLVWRVSERTSDLVTLRMIARNSLALAGLMCLLYMAGASSEAITRLLAAVRTTRKETVTTAPAVGKVESTTGGTSAETTGAGDIELPPGQRVRL